MMKLPTGTNRRLIQANGPLAETPVAITTSRTIIAPRVVAILKPLLLAVIAETHAFWWIRAPARAAADANPTAKRPTCSDADRRMRRPP